MSRIAFLPRGEARAGPRAGPSGDSGPRSRAERERRDA